MARWRGVIGVATLGVARSAWACLNDFEIALAEQQLRGAYAAPLPPDMAASASDVAAALGAVALVVALARAGRAL